MKFVVLHGTSVILTVHTHLLALPGPLVPRDLSEDARRLLSAHHTDAGVGPHEQEPGAGGSGGRRSENTISNFSLTICRHTAASPNLKSDRWREKPSTLSHMLSTYKIFSPNMGVPYGKLKRGGCNERSIKEDGIGATWESITAWRYLRWHCRIN